MNQQKISSIFAPATIMAHGLTPPFPLRFWALLCVICAGTVGLGAMTYLLSQPKQALCFRALLPITSASTRFYCAQAAAEQNTAEGLLEDV